RGGEPRRIPSRSDRDGIRRVESGGDLPDGRSATLARAARHPGDGHQPGLRADAADRPERLPDAVSGRTGRGGGADRKRSGAWEKRNPLPRADVVDRETPASAALSGVRPGYSGSSASSSDKGTDSMILGARRIARFALTTRASS